VAAFFGTGGWNVARRTWRPSLSQVMVPLWMLYPVWLFYTANTHFAPTLLFAVLLARAVTSAGPVAQAVSLALAVGSNQMLGACGVVVASHWIRRHGVRKAGMLILLSGAIFMATIAPFLLWNPTQFLQVTFLLRGEFPPEIMSGRFSLLPLVSPILPHASLILTLLTVTVGACVAARAKRLETIVAAMALTLAMAILWQPVSFAHYFLPVIVLLATAPVPSSLVGAPDQAPLAGPHIGRAWRKAGANFGRRA
jgi:hypothetical protein